MDALGPRGLAVVVDLIDVIALGSGGIHLVVTDRPQAVRAEVEARCPSGWRVEPLFAPQRDRLSAAAYGSAHGQGRLLLDVVDPGDAQQHPALRALNDDREWLLRRGTCAVVIVAGKDETDADAAYVRLQAQAPDFWSVRNRVHRVVGPDPERAMTDELLDRLSPRFGGDRAAARRWLDRRSVGEDWVVHRLWREGASRDAWLAMAEPSRETDGGPRPVLMEEPMGERGGGRSTPEWSPTGEAIAPERWPQPRWRSGGLDPSARAIVSELEAALERDGEAELRVLPEDAAPEAFVLPVLAVGLLESRYAIVLHLDARDGLEGAIRRCLEAAGDEPLEAEGLVAACRRLQGALGSAETLLLVTDASATEIGFLRGTRPKRAIASIVRAEPIAAFGVLAADALDPRSEWMRARLSAWAGGAIVQSIRPETAVLDARAVLGRARHGVVLVDSAWSGFPAATWQILEAAKHRVVVFTLGTGRLPAVSGLEWRGELGVDEQMAADRVLGAARGLAGEPLVEPSTVGDTAWPSPPPMIDHAHPRSDRVVLVLIGSSPAGSGYLVDPRHVLTAAHVLGAADAVVEVRLCGESKVRSATVVWRGRGKVDVALLRLAEAVEGERGDEPEWASCGRSDLEIEAMGFPRFQDEERTDRADLHLNVDTERFRGRLEPDAGLEHGRINAKHTMIPRPNEDWGGISGAGLFVQQYLVGVVTHADTDRLLGWPVAGLLEDQAFEQAAGPRTVLTDVLWPSEDQPLLRALRPWKRRVSERALPSELLDASYEVVDFEEEGRAVALGLLRRFTEDRARDRALVIVGPGGMGKTRLMLEWCRRMRSQPWIAGFVEHGVSRHVEALVRGRTPRLVVLDYAETDPGGTLALLREMVKRRQGPRMRVVLLAREEGPWLRSIGEDDRVADLLRHYEVHRLGNLYITEQARARGFEKACDRFARVTGGSSRAIVPEDSALALEDDVAKRALYVHMQALLVAYGDTETDALSPSDVLDRVLVHEQRFWKETLEHSCGQRMNDQWRHDLERAAAALVLCGGVPSVDAARALFERALPTVDARDLRTVIDCFREIYPTREGGGLVPIEPDLLGETLLARVLERDAKEKHGLERWLGLPFGEAAPDGAVTRALTVLTRLVSRSIGREWLEQLLRERGVALVGKVVDTANARARALSERTVDPPNDESLDLPGPVLAQAIQHIEDGDLAEEIGDAVPEETVECREVAATAYEVAVRLERANEPRNLPRFARLLVNLGMRLSDLGRREEALQATQEAVDIRRGLAKERPGVFLPDLASALHNLGAALNSLGRREEALRATQEAVDIRRSLAKERPDAFLPDVARSLNNLGATLSELGRREKALQATQKAVEAYRGLAKERPDAFLPDLASALNNVGAALNSLGRREEALQATQEAVDLRRDLAKERPDAFLPDLAMSLNNLGAMLSKMGRREEALQATQGAVDAYRGLAQERLDAFLPDLARALNNLGAMLSKLGRREEALQATQEAVDTHRGLAKERPDAFLPDLAGALNNLGIRLSDLGRREEALQATQEAVDLRRGLAKERPDAFLPDLASALNNLGIRLSKLGRREEALQVTQEAVDAYRGLAQERLDAVLPDLARALNNLGVRLSDLGRRGEALQATQEAVDAYRGLAKEQPDAFLPDLASALNNLGIRLSDLGRQEEALGVTQEAVDAYRDLAKERPDSFLPDLASALNNLGLRLSKLGRRAEALGVTREAVDVHRELAAQRPEAFLPELVDSLGALGSVSMGAEQPAQAAEAFAEALRLLGPFVERLPEVFEPRRTELARGLREASEASDLPIPDDLAPLLDRLGEP